jgi:3',5'-cyclic AMP phosphodiesterase CpdA
MDILHLSDLHVTDENQTLSTLWTGVERVLGPERKFDLVIISGDLTQSASVQEYAELRKFLDGSRFRGRLRHPHPSRVLLVPGNHDVYWPHPSDAPVQLSTMDASGLERFKKELSVYRRSPERSRLRLALGGLGHTDFSTIEPESPRYRQRFSNCQNFLNDFYKDAGPMVRPFNLVGPPGEDWSAHVFPEERIAFFGFNSCGRNDSRWTGACIEKEALDAAIDFKVRHCADMLCAAVWHHGLSGDRGRADFLTLEEVARFEEYGFKVGFHGHVHAGNAYRLLSSQFVVVSAGSLAAGGQDRPETVGQQFSTVELLPTRVTLDMYERRHPKQHYEVIPDRQRRINLSSSTDQDSASEASHVREHIRTTYVDEMGIAHIQVELTNVVMNGNVPLAILDQPYCNFEYDPDATIDRERERRVPVQLIHLPDGRPAFVLDVLGTGSQKLKTSYLKWSYRLSNAVALSVTELELLENRRRSYKQLDPEFDLRPHTLRFDCERLTLRLAFDPKSQAGIARALPWVEARKEHFERVGWVRDTAEEDRCRISLLRPEDSTTLPAQQAELRVDAPLVGHRYGLAFRPSRSVAKFDLAAETLATRMLKVARSAFEISYLSRTLTYVVGGSLAAELGGQIPDHSLVEAGDKRVLDLTGSWQGTIWDHAARRLFPVFGEFAIEGWGSRFACGNGVAGHAFRMSGSAAWLRGRGGSDLIYEAEVEPRVPGPGYPRRREFAWIICIPLYLGPRGPSIGVVSLAGEDENASALTHELQIQAIGLTQPQVPEIVRKRQLRLETAVNLAFWTVLAEGSPKLGLTQADHEFALRVVDYAAERAGSLVEQAG